MHPETKTTMLGPVLEVHTLLGDRDTARAFAVRGAYWQLRHSQCILGTSSTVACRVLRPRHLSEPATAKHVTPSLSEKSENTTDTDTEYRLTPPLTIFGEDLDVDGGLPN